MIIRRGKEQFYVPASGSDTQRLEQEVHVVGKIKEQIY